MTKTHQILTMVATILFSGAARASEWWAVDLTHGQAFFVDRSSISQYAQSGRAFRQAWVAQYSNVAEKDGSTLNKTLWVFDCAESSISIRSSASYRKDGSIVDSWSVRPGSLDFSPIVPDSTGQAWASFVCNYEKAAGRQDLTIGNRKYIKVDDVDEAASIFLSGKP
jgi:hypothetical protein